MDTTTPQRTRKELVTPAGVVIAFTHEKGSWPMLLWKKGQRVEVTATRRTTCTLMLKVASGEYLVGTGEAICSPSDTFEYEMGRQVALYDALKRAPRQHHREVMKTYLGRPGAKPWRLNAQGHLPVVDVADVRYQIALRIAELAATLA